MHEQRKYFSGFSKIERRQFVLCVVAVFSIYLPKLNTIINWVNELIHVDLPTNYPSFNPPIFFSIGEVLATISILLAVYQFQKEKWEIPLEVREYVKPAVVALTIGGFISILISSVVSFYQSSNILLLSIFWQITSSVLIVSGIAYLFLKATNKGLYNPKTKTLFIKALRKRITSRSIDKINIATDSIITNFETIIKEVSKDHVPNEAISDFTRTAHFILTQIITNPSFTHHVATTRADFIQSFLVLIKKYELYNNRSVSSAMDAIVNALFSNKESYFYNELKHSVNGVYFRPFLQQIFFDQKMFLSFRPLDQIGVGRDEIDIEKIDLFCATLEMAFEGFFENPREIDFERSAYHTAFENVEKILSNIMEEYDKKGDFNIILSKAHPITFLIGWRFQNLYKEALKNNKLSKYEIDAPLERRSYGIYPLSLTSGYAQLVFKLLCALGQYKTKETGRINGMNLADHILVFVEPELENIRNALLEFIWDKINGSSLSNIKGFYPVVLPVFLSIVGMWQDTSPERKAIYNKTVEFLENELKPKILSGATMADGQSMENMLLPTDVIFNRAKGLFEYQLHKETQEMIIR